MKIFKYSILFIPLIVCYFSCNNKDTTKKYHILSKFEMGVKYYFTSTSQSNTTINASNKKIEMSNKTETGFIYELLNDSAGFRHLKITYDVFKATIKKDEQVQELDISNTVALNPVDDFLAKLKGASVIVYSDSKGKVLELKGYKELTDSLLILLKVEDINIRQTLQQQISGLVGVELIKSNMEQNFVIFPDSAIEVGHKWQKKTTQSAQFNFTFNNNYFFEDVKNNIAYLSANADINTENNTITVMNMNVTSDLKGKQNASYKVDVNSGLVIEGKSKMNIEGHMKTMGKDIPVAIETSTTFSSRKM